MIEIHCPYCNKYLLDADILIGRKKCKCGRWVDINIVTSSGLEKLSLTEQKTVTII